MSIHSKLVQHRKQVKSSTLRYFGSLVLCLLPVERSQICSVQELDSFPLLMYVRASRTHTDIVWFAWLVVRLEVKPRMLLLPTKKEKRKSEINIAILLN